MEEEIDLRAYVEVLLRWKWWIAGLAVVAALVALVVSLLLPPTFAATALVAVTEPRYVMNFDPRIKTTDDLQPAYAAYPELAGSDALLQEVLVQAETLPEGVETLDDLREAVEAKAGADASLVRLTVEARDPRVAAALANLWAERFVVRANDLYGSANAEQVTFLETQLATAEATLAETEQALVDFAARNDGAILEAKLTSAQQDQANYLSEQRQLARLLQDIEELIAQLEVHTDGEATLGDELAVLQLRTSLMRSVGTREQSWTGSEEGVEFRIVDSDGAGSGVQLLVGEDEPLIGSTVAELVSLLEVMEDAATQNVEENERQLTALEPTILDLQQRLQEIENEGNRLDGERDVAQETYTTLARKVSEAKIAVADTGGEVQLASQAAVPDEDVRPRKALNTAVAGALGLMVGVCVVLVLEWWSGDRDAG